jgi:hypothetical protein
VVEAVVRSGVYRQIIEPLEKALFVEKESLFAAGLEVVMSRNVSRKSHVEASPSLAILLMRVDLLHLEAGRGEKKGSREIVPHRITGEVKPV